MNIDLSNRIAIITGAGKGIGRACALELASHGATVIVNNRRKLNDPSPSSADVVVNQIREAGGKAVANYSSIEEKQAGQEMVEQALTEFGRLDIVVNNAGIALNRTAIKTTDEELRNVFEINFFAAVALTQAALPALKQSSAGRLVYCISSAGLYSGHGLSGYGASKAAMWAYMRACAKENIKHGLHINALAPFASTQMTNDHIEPSMQRLLSPETVAPLVAWLTSPDCEVSGETFITAAGRVRVAHKGETESVVFTNAQEAAAAARQVLNSTANMRFDNSHDAFLDITNP